MAAWGFLKEELLFEVAVLKHVFFSIGAHPSLRYLYTWSLSSTMDSTPVPALYLSSKRTESSSSLEPGLVQVCDLFCGRGLDTERWAEAGIGRYIGVGISLGSQSALSATRLAWSCVLYSCDSLRVHLYCVKVPDLRAGSDLHKWRKCCLTAAHCWRINFGCSYVYDCW